MSENKHEIPHKNSNFFVFEVTLKTDELILVVSQNEEELHLFIKSYDYCIEKIFDGYKTYRSLPHLTTFNIVGAISTSPDNEAPISTSPEEG